jgi:hypothetical protein
MLALARVPNWSLEVCGQIKLENSFLTSALNLEEVGFLSFPVSGNGVHIIASSRYRLWV